jgi:hypothetical protein
MAAVVERVLERPAPRSGALAWPWTYAGESTRDLRLDLLRGFCVFAMVVDHVGGASWAHAVSGAGEYFVSAAEGFVFLSGFVMGMVYGNIIDREGLSVAVKKALLRSWTLYKLTVALSLIFGVLLVLQHYDLGPFESWPRWVADIATLRQTIYLGDIPLIYTLLMATGAGALWLLRKGRTPWLLAASAGLWLAYQLNADWAGNFPWAIDNNTQFHFAAWQIYFVPALAMGYHRQTVSRWLSRIPKGPFFFAATVIFSFMLYLHLSAGSSLPAVFQDDAVRARVEAGFVKGAAGPLRLVAAVFTFQFAYLFVTYAWQPLRQMLGWLLLPIGQNALYAYAMHLLVLAALYAPLDRLTDHGLASNTVAQLAVLLLVWGMVKTRFLFNVVPR